MMFQAKNMKVMLLSVAASLRANSSYLCELDSEIGDGDHGIAMLKISSIIEDICAEENDDISIAILLGSTGEKIMANVGGSSGMLWGEYFTSMGKSAEKSDNIDDIAFKNMFIDALDGLEAISGAGEGDKTMMDTLIPATKAINECDGDIKQALSAAVEAGRVGAEKTVNYLAKFGRAKNLKERAIGHKDAGAVSALLILEAFHESLIQL